MFVNHSGWTAEQGFFSYDIFIDEKREDYEIHYADGSVAKQNSPFHEVTRDWNYDGDVYTLLGAFFTKEGSGGEFWTPENMVSALIEAMEGERRHGAASVISIPGIELPEKENRPTLEYTIRQSERRAMHKDIERNRKMNILGIRPSNEPWAH